MKEVYASSARYKLVINPGANQEIREDRPCFLKAIIDEYYTNMTSNTAVARRNLARLKTVPQSNITRDSISEHNGLSGQPV